MNWSQALLDAVAVGAAWLDRELVIRHCNRTLEGWLGRPGAEIRDRALGQVFGEELAGEMAPLARRALTGERASQHLHLRDGSRAARPWMVRYAPHRDGSRQVDAVMLSAVELDEREEQERSRREHELEEVQRIACIGTYHTDLKRGTWPASEGFCRIFGFEPGGVYTQEEFQAIVHPDDLDRVMAYFGDCLTQRRPFDYEYRCVRRDTGEVIDVRSTSPIFYDEQGRPDRIIGIKQDITESKTLQRQLTAAQRMEAVGRLAGGVAHDFNNMLTAILGCTDVATLGLPGDSPATAHLTQVTRAAERARDTGGQLLAFSRRRIVEPSTVDLNETVRGVDRLLRRLLGEDVDLVTRLEDELWTTRVDPAAIEQVIVNLAVNARDAMPEGGTLIIETGHAVLDAPLTSGPGGAVDAGEHVVIAVSDSGTGMDEATSSQIFEPFFTTKEEGRGTGLGLATCYGLVTQASGRIAVYSEPGDGTTFKVYLQRARRPADPTPLERVAAAAGGTERVLVVEDDDALRALVVTLLGDLGNTVVAARDGDEALRMLADLPAPPDLLLTDMVMPSMSGRALGDRLRAHCPQVRVLYMSGYTTNAVVQRGELGEGVALLQKPFSRDELGRRVRAVLDG